MRIERLLMTGFGRFQGRTLDLGPGLNIVVGPNEAGKTTIQKFILGMLYGFKKRGQRRDFTDDVARYRPWQGGDYRGALIYTLADGRTYRVERDFDPARDDVRLYDEVLGTDLTDKYPRDRRKELLFAEVQFKLSEEVFRSTAWVGQLQVGQLELGKELLTRLANMQESGRDDLSVKDALDILEERMRQIGSERAPTRPYARVVRLLEERQADLERATAAWEQVRRWEVRLADARATLAQVQAEQAELLRRLDWVLWHELEVRLQRVEATASKVADLRREADQLAHYADFPSHLRDRLLRFQAEAEDAERRLTDVGGAELPALENEIERLRVNVTEMEHILSPMVQAAEHGDEIAAQVEALEERVADLKREVERPDGPQARDMVTALRRERRSASSMSVVWAVLAVTLAAAGVFVFFLLSGTVPRGAQVGAAGGLWVLAAAFLALGAVAWRRSGLAAQQMELLRVQMEQGFSKSEVAREQLPQLEEERRQLLRSVGAGSVSDIRKSAARYQQMVILREKQQVRLEQLESRAAGMRLEADRLQNARAEVAAILREAGVESADQFETGCTLAEAWTKADREARTMSETLSGLLGGETLEDLDLEVARLGAKLTDEEPNEHRSSTVLQEEIRRLQTHRADLNALIGDLGARIETSGQDLPDQADLAQEIESLKEQKAAFDEEMAVLELARSVMHGAAEEVHRDFAPKLNAAMSQRVAELTGGRYRAVKVDESLSVRAITDGQRTVDLLSLSAGTIDQFYLGLRMALLEMAQGGGEPIPLMLDDPFVQYDDDRVRGAMLYLGSISEKHQVIFMTCHNREVRIAQQLGLNCHVINLAADEAMEAAR